MKKIIASAAFFIGMTAAANAADLGNGLSAGAELDINYTTGSEAWVYKITPEVGYAPPWGVDLSAETSIMIDDPEFTGISWEAEWMIPTTPVEAYAKIKSDADHDFGDTTIGLSWSF